MPQENEIIRSEFVQEITTNKPDFWVRHGIGLFFLLVCLLSTICWFIKYPDLVTTTAKLTSINTPKQVITVTSGKLTKLSISENQHVLKNEIIGYIESTANHENIIKLSASIDTIQSLLENNKSEQIQKILSSPSSQLGELQAPFQTFATAYLNFKNYLLNGFYFHKKNMLAIDMANLKKLNSNLFEQKELNEQDLSLSQKTFDANQSLKDDNIISSLDYRNEKSKLIIKKLTLPQITNAIINNEAAQNEKQKEIAELENIIAQQKSIFQQALNTFRSQLEDWKKKYLLIAPIEGKIAFATFIQENQQLQANQIICYINPENSQYYAQILIPQHNFGKVQIGQNVLLKFPSYPFQEYGSLTGKIDFINHIPTDSGFLAKVVLTDGLNTNYKKQIQYRDGLIAQGEIITKDIRLLQRLYYTITQWVRK